MARNNKLIGIIVGAVLLIGAIVGIIIFCNSGDEKKEEVKPTGQNTTTNPAQNITPAPVKPVEKQENKKVPEVKVVKETEKKQAEPKTKAPVKPAPVVKKEEVKPKNVTKPKPKAVSSQRKEFVAAFATDRLKPLNPEDSSKKSKKENEESEDEPFDQEEQNLAEQEEPEESSVKSWVDENRRVLRSRNLILKDKVLPNEFKHDANAADFDAAKKLLEK